MESPRQNTTDTPQVDEDHKDQVKAAQTKTSKILLLLNTRYVVFPYPRKQ